MKLLKKTMLWIIFACLAVFGVTLLPSLPSIFSLLIAILIAPIEKWQNFLGKYIKGKFKIIAIVVLAILMFAAFSTLDVDQDTDAPTPPTTSQSTTASSTIPTNAPTDSPASTPTELTTMTPTAVPTEAPTEAPTAAPTEKPTEAPTAAPTEKPTVPPHTHSFSAATCNKPKTCSCGETEGKANGHSFVNGACSTCGVTDPDFSEITYILNTNSKKFHRSSCHKLPTDNRQDTTLSRDEIIEEGYKPCKLCNP